MHPTMHPGAGDRATATPLHAGPRAGEAGAIDLLGRQIAELTRQVAELQAERQGFQDEIRRLHAIVADLAPPAPCARSGPCGSSKPSRASTASAAEPSRLARASASGDLEPAAVAGPPRPRCPGMDGAPQARFNRGIPAP
jgi:hypothetical protein